MSRISALGCVARTVLINGSSTGLSVVPRCAPSRASRRRTPTPDAATSAAWPCTAATAARARLGLAWLVLSWLVLSWVVLSWVVLAWVRRGAGVSGWGLGGGAGGGGRGVGGPGV